MGNINSRRHAGKVVLPDGSIHEFQESMTAAELMLEHPQQVVVEFNCMQDRLIRPTPLPADRKLEANKTYLMLPLRRGRLPSFSSQDAQKILLRVNAVLTQSLVPYSLSKTLGFFAKIRPLNVGEVHKFVVPKKDEVEEEDEDDGFSVERKDYLMCQGSSKGWKPSLDTIKEIKERKKDSSLVVVASKVGKRIENKGLVWG